MSKNNDYKKLAKKNKNKKNFDEQQKNAIAVEKDDKPKKKDKIYRNPARTIAGKIIIIVLALLMGLGGLFSLIYLIINSR